MKKRIFAMMIVMMLVLTSIPTNVLAKGADHDKSSKKGELTKVFEDKITVKVKGAPEGAELVIKKADTDDLEDLLKKESGAAFTELMSLDISVKTADDKGLEKKVKVSLKSDDFKKLSKEEDISEDQIKDLEEQLQKITDKFTKEIDSICDNKEKELMEI